MLPLWSQAAQSRRQAPDASLTELFMLLHGMIFTNIQLDDFKGVLARFEEKLQIEGESPLSHAHMPHLSDRHDVSAPCRHLLTYRLYSCPALQIMLLTEFAGDEVEEREWIMMAVVNIGGMLEYGRSTAILRRVSGIMGRDTIPGSSASPILNGKVKLARRSEAEDRRMDVDDEDDPTGVNGLRAMAISQDSPIASEASAVPSEPELPMGLQHALQLSFVMLTHVLGKPTLRRTSAVSHPMLNPYITIILTFLATALKDKNAEQVLTRTLPWEPLAAFLSSDMPRKVMHGEWSKEAVLLSSGTNPLPEDWCMRGLGWGGKKVYERGFWDKATRGEEKSLESEVLDKITQVADVQDGIIEDDAEDDEQAKHRAEVRRSEIYGRWIRVARAAIKISKIAQGFAYRPPVMQNGRGEWSVEGQLARRVARWAEEAQLEKLEEERRLKGTRWGDDDEMEVDEDDRMDGIESESDEDEEVSGEVKVLKASGSHVVIYFSSNTLHSGTPPILDLIRAARALAGQVSSSRTWSRGYSGPYGPWAYYSRLRHQHSPLVPTRLQRSRREPQVDHRCAPPGYYGTGWTRLKLDSTWRRCQSGRGFDHLPPALACDIAQDPDVQGQLSVKSQCSNGTNRL